MHPLFLLTTIATFHVLEPALECAEYNIRVYANDEEVGVVELSIDAHFAIATVGSVSQRFDLKNERWQHDQSKQWVTMAECKQWAKKSEEKTRQSTVSVSAEMRPFVDWGLNPNFKVEQDGRSLRLTSGKVDYVILADKSDEDVSSYFRYARLNAYKKAMTGASKFPIHPELKVLDELERRKLIPSSMEVRFPAVNGAPRLRSEFTIADK